MAFPKFCVGPKSVGYDVKVFYCIRKILLINYRAKHPVKVHVWAGISIRGRTGVCIFDGIMRAPLYVEIFKETLFPSLIVFALITVTCRTTTPNTPLDWSRLSLTLMGVNWWRTPSESLANPIEHLWHELKEFIRRGEAKRTRQSWWSGSKDSG